MIRRMLKYILIVVAAAIIGYTGLTVYGEVTKTEAAKMASSVQLAQAQAENMNQTLADVRTFTADDHQQPGTTESVVPESFASIDGSRDTGPDGQSSETKPQTPAQPGIAKITNIDILIAEWEPRYDSAKLAYVKFEAAINNAKATAADYFAKQQALIEQIQDSANQVPHRQDYENDLILYRRWEAQADSALAQARKIGIQLDDMDVSLSIIKHRSDFVFDASAFQEVPTAIVELDRQLADFQVASDNIRAATDSPFEVK